MKLDTTIAPVALSAIAPLARAAEGIGFDAIWTAETSHDPYLPLTLVAEHTSRIKFGTSIAVAFPRSPLVHAQIAWDLQAQSNGRFILGLGTQVKGHNERRFGIPWEAPGPRLREMIVAIRAIRPIEQAQDETLEELVGSETLDEAQAERVEEAIEAEARV